MTIQNIDLASFTPTQGFSVSELTSGHAATNGAGDVNGDRMDWLCEYLNRAMKMCYSDGTNILRCNGLLSGTTD